jgi:hypothetical protein
MLTARRTTVDSLGGGVVQNATTHLPVTGLGLRAASPPGVEGAAAPAEGELLEQTLAFSGSYVSDDGTVTISRAVDHAFAYSGARFGGRCTVCARALLMPDDGEPLADIGDAVRFVATHDHGGLD